MKYKYTRKEIADKWETTIKYSGNDLIRDLLAQKEDNKEWKPCDCPKGGIDGDGMVCDKCGGTEWVKVKSTPSPLEIEDIKEITGVYRDIGGGVSYTEKGKKEDDNLSVLINKLISNQKKLYQLIKEKL